MLLRFRVGNARSFRDEQELSLVVQPGDEPQWSQNVALASGEELSIYPLIGVFGGNASGKSNLLIVFRQMCSAVLRSYADWVSEPGVPRDAFVLDPECTEKSSFFEVDFVCDEVRYTYGFELGADRVEGEWLHAYPRGHRQVWFDRDASRDREFDFPSERLRGRAQLVPLTRPDALFLSVAGTNNHPQLKPLFDWFRSNLRWAGHEGNRRHREELTRRALGGPRYGRIVALLQVADLGIRRVELVKSEIGPVANQIRLWHAGAHGDVYPVAWEDESFGTRLWFSLLGPVLRALDHGSVLLVDELDGSLHPRFAAEIIRLFQDPEVNVNRSQLIFTSHDVTVLGGAAGHRLLDPGQVWLVEKDKGGASELFPLTAAQPGPGENLESSYLAGRFGGVPSLSEGQIGRQLRTTRQSEDS